MGEQGAPDTVGVGQRDGGQTGQLDALREVWIALKGAKAPSV